MQKRIKFAAMLGIACLNLVYVQSLLAASDSPYLIEKKAFKKDVRSVALSPLYVPDLLKLSPEMRAHIEAEATTALSKTKIKSVGIPAYAEIRDLFTEQIGGLRNEAGEVDDQRLAVVRDHTKREMRMRHEVDGFAEISLRAVTAVFSDDRAEWDGVKRKVKSSGDGFSLFGGKDYQGSIAGVSFQLAIYDRSDELLYVQRGGIDVLQERQGEKLVNRTDEFLNDPKRLKKAVQMAFKPL